jgi:thiamine transport system permease protein
VSAERGPALSTLEHLRRAEPSRSPSALPRAVRTALFAVPAAFLAVFFIWPVATILARGWSAGAVLDVLAEADLRQIAWFTLWQAALSTLLSLAVGLPMAFVVGRYRFAGRRVVLAVMTAAFVLPTVVVGAAFLALLPDRWHGTVPAILVAHVFFNYAVVVRTVGSFWSHLDPRLEDAARVLGASRWRILREVTLPLLRPAIAAAASITFLFSFTSFGVVLLLGGPRHPTLEVEIYRRTAETLDLTTAAALAILQLLFLAVVLAWWSRTQERRSVALHLQPAASTRVPPRTIGQRALVAANLVVFVLLIGVPLLRLVERSFATPSGHGLDWYRALGERGPGGGRLVDPLGSVGTSLRFGLAAASLAVGLGVCASVAIAAGRRGGRILDTGLMLPLGTSAVTIGFGYLITFDGPPLDLRSSWLIVPLAHALIAVPFVVRAVLPVLRSIDPRLREAAAVLGAPPGRVWWEVDRPLLSRAALVGAAFAFAVSVGDFGASAFLARTGQPTLPVAIVRLLGRPGAANVGQAYALAVVLMVLTAAIIFAVERAQGEGATF